MDFSVRIKIPKYNFQSKINKKVSSLPNDNYKKSNILNINVWSDFMKYKIENAFQNGVSLEKIDEILNEQTQKINLNPVEQYNKLQDGDKIALKHLVNASKIMNTVFMKQEHKKGTWFLEELTKKANIGDLAAKKMLELYNIFNGIQDERKETTYIFKDEKLSDGKNFYPDDLKPEELINYLKNNINETPKLLANNTVVRRDGDKFVGIPYTIEYKEEFEKIANEILEAAKYSTNEQFNNYLRLQAKALTSTNPEDDYNADAAWVNLCDTPLEFTISRECYDDKFTGKILEDKELKAMLEKNNIEACSKDMLGIRVGIVEREETRKLQDYKNYLKPFSKTLPFADTYVQSVDVGELPKQTLVDVDLVNLSGDCRASRPGITLAQNLPNSDKLASKRHAGNRNVFHRDIRKTFDPVLRKKFLDSLVEPEFRELYSNDADHLFTISHELMHSLGPTKTSKGLDKKTTLGDYGDAIEEAKADLGGLLMCDYFTKIGKHTQKQFDEIALTWAAGLLPQEMPSKNQAHAIRKVAMFNYMKGCGAIKFAVNGKISIDKNLFVPSVRSMLEHIIRLQLDGDSQKATEFIDTWCVWTDELEYASKILKSLKPKIYKQVILTLADKITE